MLGRCVDVRDTGVPVRLVHGHPHLEDAVLGDTRLLEEQAKLHIYVHGTQAGRGRDRQKWRKRERTRHVKTEIEIDGHEKKREYENDRYDKDGSKHQKTLYERIADKAPPAQRAMPSVLLFF